MRLKTDETGNAVLNDGKPVYVADDGKEIAFDAAQAFGKIQQLNAEAKSHRLTAQEAQEQLRAFEGIDPQAARQALQNQNKSGDKNLVDAGEIDRVKQALSEQFQQQLQEREKKLNEYKDGLSKMQLSNAFGSSSLVQRMAIPREFVESYFGQFFEYDETSGKVVGKYANGNPIMSRENPGDVASFDEALETLASQYPGGKEKLFQGSTGGTGASGAVSSGANQKLVKDMNAAEKTTFIENHGLKAWEQKVFAERGK